MENSNRFIAPLIVLVLVVLAVAAYKVLNKKSPEEVMVTTSPSSVSPSVSSASPSAGTSAGIYENGTYTVVGDYRSPAGPENLNVSVTLTDGIITDAEVISPATHPTTKKMQAMFIGAYKPFVIGKNIDDVMLTKVSGSSLSPKGFNDALAKIKIQASS